MKDSKIGIGGNQVEGTIRITRYSPDGVVECMGHFLDREGASFIPDDSMRLGYPSNCKEVILHKGQEVFWLERISSGWLNWHNKTALTISVWI